MPAFPAAARGRFEVDDSSDWSHPTTVKHIAAAKFKEQCLALLDAVDPEGLVITKRGKPVARLLPIQSGSKHRIGCLRGKLTVNGDLTSTGVIWRPSPPGTTARKTSATRKPKKV